MVLYPDTYAAKTFIIYINSTNLKSSIGNLLYVTEDINMNDMVHLLSNLYSNLIDILV